jgi:hypothetical protein
VGFHHPGDVGGDHLVDAAEHHALALAAQALLGEVVAAQHDVLGGDHVGPAVGGVEDVLGGHHQDARLDLGHGAQGHVHGHLVAVEIGVEGGADQGVQPDGLTFHQHRLERLDAQAVQGGCPVEQDRVVLDHFIQHVPHFRDALFDHLLGLTDGGGVALVFQTVEDEGLEQFQGHLLGQPALVQLEVGTHHDDRTAGVVHPLAQQVLAEPALLALEGVGQGLERAVGDAAQQAAALAVLEQSVHGFLQHALLVAHDHFRGAQFQQLLQAVVAVDDAAVEVVQVGGGEPAAVQGHQGPQFGGQHRDHVEDHPLGLVAAALEGFGDLEPLGDLHPLLGGGLGLHEVTQLDGQRLHVHVLEQFLDGLGAHLGPEALAVLGLVFAELILGQDLPGLQLGVAGIGDSVGLEVEHPLQILERDVQQVADAAGHALEEPDVAHRGGQGDVTHALAAHGLAGDFDPALVADDTFELLPLVFAAEAFPVVHGSEDPGAEQAVPFGLQAAVVDGFRFGDLAAGPGTDHIRRRQGDPDAFIRIDVGLLGIHLDLFEINVGSTRSSKE